MKKEESKQSPFKKPIMKKKTFNAPAADSAVETDVKPTCKGLGGKLER